MLRAFELSWYSSGDDTITQSPARPPWSPTSGRDQERALAWHGHPPAANAGLNHR